ncbi:tetratricopeptide repeat protein [Leptolyngbya sp. PCC 7375]|nr:tetratricopeptide repeat protein [Leptolyngbya sp. PCC 7375]
MNLNLSRKNIPLLFSFIRYKRSIEHLHNPKSALSIDQALEVLSARDALQDVLKTTKQVPGEIFSQVMQLDLYLEQKANKILQVLNLSQCRESLSITSQDWWWHLDSRHQINWLIRGLVVITWTGSLGLLIDISSRFLSGGVGIFGAVAVVFPSLLTLLQARSELTEAGREGFDQLISKLPILKSQKEKAKLGSLSILFGLLMIFWFSLPLISQVYNQRGIKNNEQRRSRTAEQNYLRAIALNPDNIYAYYNLGNLYEEWQQYDKARTHYRIAVKGGLPEAYNNLARLFIQRKEYSQAVALLNQGLLQTRDQKSFPEVKYNLFKNLGWARFQQKRYQEAQNALQVAISISSDSDVTDYIANRGSAYCLFAQVLEKQHEQLLAIKQWQKCCELGSTLNSDEDSWLGLAHKKLKEAGKSCP